MDAKGKRKRIIFEETDDDSDSDESVGKLQEERRRFLGSDTDESDGEVEDDMANFIVEEDDDNAEAQEELRSLLANATKRRKQAHKVFVRAEEEEAAKSNPPTQKQINALKRLCSQHKKAMPPLERVCKNKMSSLINILMMQQWGKWKYGDDLPEEPYIDSGNYKEHAPDSILNISDEKKRKTALYSFWTNARPDMLPFDDNTVETLKEDSSVEWKSSDFIRSQLTINIRNLTYSDKYIKLKLKKTFPTLTDDDIRLGIAKCRRNLICMSDPFPNPTGKFCVKV